MLDEAQTIARDYYDDALPYHNWAHVQDVMDAAEELLARCWTHNVAVDDDVVRYAVLFHDANYRHGFTQHEAMGYDSMEAYSAALAADELSALNVSKDTADQVYETILATRRDAELEESDPSEWKVMRAADLRGLMRDYDTFKENSLKLREEHELLTGETLTAQEWADSAETVLLHYLDQDIRITPEHDTGDGVSEFHVNARQNLERFREEYGMN